MGACHAECAPDGSATTTAANAGICRVCRCHYAAGDQIVVIEKKESEHDS